MAKTITTGIDIGTNQIKVVIAEHERGRSRQFPKIIGNGRTQSRGLRHGYIINSDDITQSIISAITDAEGAAGAKVKKAYISIGGVGLEEARARGEMLVARADGEVSQFDISRAMEEAEAMLGQKLLNRKVLHTIPLKFKIDGHEVFGRAEGMKGQKIEVETLFVTCLEQHLNDLIQAVENAGVEVEDMMAAPIAGSFVTLTKAQKIAGCVLANVGAETVSIIVYENNIPISLKVLPIGSTDITNDIALGLRIPLEEAEQLKLGSLTGDVYPRKKLEEIVSARLTDIFDLIEAHLKKIGKNGLLPAGIILTGGGSGIATIDDLAKAALKLPSRVATLHFADLPRDHIKDSSWAVAYGLCIWGLSAESEPLGIKLARRTGGNIVSWLRQFMP
jgi:cell division protein FtsA